MTDTLSARHKLQMRWVGMSFVVMSALAFSLAGVLTKAIESDVWVVGSWRGLIGGMLIVGYVYLQAKRRSVEAPFRLGWRGWLLASLIAGAGLAFIAAFKLTYVANVAVIVAALPLVTALIEWAITGQKVQRFTLVAILISAIGVLVTVSGSLGSINLLGDSLAILMILMQGLAMVLIRVFKDTPAVFAIAVGGFQVCLIGLIFSDPLDVTYQDAVLLVAFGLSVATASILLIEGLQLISATEAGLLGTVEVPAAIFLAWVFLAETPPSTSIVGGALILCAVFWNAIKVPQTN